MELLHTPIRPYAWGSRTAIAALQGRPSPSDGPEAELWIGAHPVAPSTLVSTGGSGKLTEAIAADPVRMLGEVGVARFGPRLPFLIKVLAAAEPLSLQVHPDLAQAQAGFAAEEAAGVPLSAGQRNYVDPYHKPELLVAVEHFDALCGFRHPEQSAMVLEALGVAQLKPVIAVLRSGPTEQRLRGAVEMLMSWPEAERPDLVAAAAAADPDLTGEYAQAARLAAELGQRYPGDVGVLVALLLNHVRLAPGEAVWMPAGNPHSYLSGFGVEAMAASDNVLRGGMTLKRVDVPELLRVLRFEVLADPVVRPVPIGPGLTTWPVPAKEFRLMRVVVGAGTPRVQVPGGGARAAVCLAGTVQIDDGIQLVTLRQGQAAFAPAYAGQLRCTGQGTVFCAGVPDAG